MVSEKNTTKRYIGRRANRSALSQQVPQCCKTQTRQYGKDKDKYKGKKNYRIGTVSKNILGGGAKTSLILFISHEISQTYP